MDRHNTISLALTNGKKISLNLNPLVDFLESNSERNPEDVIEHFSKGMELFFPLLQKKDPAMSLDFINACAVTLEQMEAAV
jgi:hypothetical protein